MPPVVQYLFIVGLVIGILAGGTYLYKNVNADCVRIPFIGGACGVAVAK